MVKCKKVCTYLGPCQTQRLTRTDQSRPGEVLSILNWMPASTRLEGPSQPKGRPPSEHLRRIRGRGSPDPGARPGGCASRTGEHCHLYRVSFPSQVTRLGRVRRRMRQGRTRNEKRRGENSQSARITVTPLPNRNSQLIPRPQEVIHHLRCREDHSARPL